MDKGDIVYVVLLVFFFFCGCCAGVGASLEANKKASTDERLVKIEQALERMAVKK